MQQALRALPCAHLSATACSQAPELPPPTKPKPGWRGPQASCLSLFLQPSAASDHYHLGTSRFLDKELLQGCWGWEQ